MKIITGYVGSPHITSADDQSINYGLVDAQRLTVLPCGNRFSAAMQDATTLRIMDGVGMLYGIAFRTNYGSYDDVAIAACAAGKKRIDVVSIHYERNSSNVESCSWKVFQGTETTGTPTVPDGDEGGIPWQGAASCSVPMFRVTLNGASASVAMIFDQFPSITDIAATAAKLAGTKVLVSESIKSVAIPTLAGNETSSHITDSVVLPSGTDFFDAVPVDAGWLQPLGFGFSNSQRYVVFQVINVSTRTISNGVLRYLVRYYKTL